MPTSKRSASGGHQDLVEAGKRFLADGHTAQALATLRTAVQANPNDADAVLHYGRAALRAGHANEAQAALIRAVDLDPQNLAACKDLALACLSAGDIQGIEDTANRLARLAPRDRVTLNMVGLAHMNRFEFDGAAEAFCSAVEVEPSAIGAFVNLEVLSMRALRHRRLLEKSPNIASFRKEAINRLKESYRRGELHDDDIKDLLMLLAGSEETFGEALELSLDLSKRNRFSMVLANQMAMIFQLAGDLANLRRFDAITYAFDSSSPFARFNHAQVNLSAGYEHWKECWEAFRDAVVTYSSAGVSEKAIPTWRGESLENRRLFVYQEQGVGDAILALRVIPFLAKRGIDFDLWVNSPLTGLARSIAGFEKLIDSPGRPDPRSLGCDFAISLFGLIATLDLDHDTLAGNPTVLVPEGDRAAPARERLRALPGRRIGLAYGGNPTRRDDWFRAVPPAALRPLAALDGISWANLSIDDRPDRPEVIRMFQMVDPMKEAADFEDTAAIISELDAVIAIDSSVAHLACGLGKPVWVLVPTMLDWRWQIGSDTKPWWPTATLLRSPKLGCVGNCHRRADETGRRLARMTKKQADTTRANLRGGLGDSARRKRPLRQRQGPRNRQRVEHDLADR